MLLPLSAHVIELTNLETNPIFNVFMYRASYSDSYVFFVWAFASQAFTLISIALNQDFLPFFYLQQKLISVFKKSLSCCCNTWKSLWRNTWLLFYVFINMWILSMFQIPLHVTTIIKERGIFRRMLFLPDIYSFFSSFSCPFWSGWRRFLKVLKDISQITDGEGMTSSALNHV